MIRVVLILLCLLPLQLLQAQSPLDERYDFTADNLELPDAISQLSSSTGVNISFSGSFFDPDRRVNLNLKDTPLREILSAMLEGHGIDFKLSGKKVVLYRRKGPLSLSGFLIDSESGEALVAATIQALEAKTGILSNEYGYFNLRLPPGQYSLLISRLGYEKTELTVDLQQNKEVRLEIKPNLRLEDVVISPEETNASVQSLDPRRPFEISRKFTRAMPALGGEEDIVRAAHLLPGVHAGVDGTAGLYVRGGDAGHNLMLLDGVPVYIPFHLLGVYSVYNSSTIKSAKLMKGSFSSRYGGRLASIMDVRTREGNLEGIRGEASVNLVNGRLMLESPIPKINSSLMVSGRMSPRARLLSPVFDRTYFRVAGGELETKFSDLLVKFNSTLSSKDRIYATFFTSNDEFGKEFSTEGDSDAEESETETYWRNMTAALRWNHLFNSRLFSNSTLTYSRYSYKYTSLDRLTTTDTLNPEEIYFVDNRSTNYEFGLRNDFDYSASTNHQLRFGGGLSFRVFNPILSYFDQDSDELQTLLITDRTRLEELIEPNETQALEGYLYWEDRISIGSRLMVNAGLRGSGFLQNEGNHFRLEPRLSAHYRPHSKVTLFVSGSRMVQYLHLISNTAIRFPNDLWLPSSSGILPSESWQAEAGANLDLTPQFSLSVEAYYKAMQNLYAVPPGFDFLDSINLSQPESFLNPGSGTAYGLETMLSFHGKNSFARLSHTWSKTERQFDGENLNQPFPHDFDRRHQVKFYLAQGFAKRFQIAFNWVGLSPGPRLNLADIARGLGLTNIESYAPGEKNLYRDAPYHRLDISLGYSLPHNRFTHRFRIGAYNVYDRRNVAYYRRDLSVRLPVEVYAIPFTPSASYSFSF